MANNDQKRLAMLTLVEEWRQSGENRAHFAAKHQISFAKFQYWVRISKAAATPKDFSELLLPISGETHRNARNERIGYSKRAIDFPRSYG